MNQTMQSPGPYNALAQATTVILLFQAVVLLAQLFDDSPYSGAMTGLLAATVALSAVNRRLATASQGNHATSYIVAWRYAVLALLGFASALVALKIYLPDAQADGVPSVVAMLLAAIIALKGALFGKLKPGGVLGLRLKWTMQSRLAWEQAHRAMGRILFVGGLIGIFAAPFVPFPVAVAWIVVAIFIGIVTGVLTSRRVWKSDPERVQPAP